MMRWKKTFDPFQFAAWVIIIIAIAVHSLTLLGIGVLVSLLELKFEF